MKLGRRAWLMAVASAAPAYALGRTPIDGRFTMKLPWPVDSIDPHSLDDPTAALFGSAISDPLYSLDRTGNAYAALAASMPKRDGQRLLVSLRPDLRTARGRSITSRDVVFSLTRARKRAGAGPLSELGRFDATDPLTVAIGSTDAKRVARALSSPVTAILPSTFHPSRPDGTGAFSARVTSNQLVLSRNPNAARGAAFLERIVVHRASDLADALRSFEVGDVDIGWLGSGLHKKRRGAVRFDAGAVGWVVLATGTEAGSWGGPGVAQGLIDAIPPERLAHLKLGKLPRARGHAQWGGPPIDIIVPNDSPHLREVANTVASVLARPGHELRVSPRPRNDINQRRRSKRFGMLVDIVRHIGPAGRDSWYALAASLDPRRARHPPELGSFEPRRIARTMSLGVVGELRVSGFHVGGIHLQNWDLGAAWR